MRARAARRRNRGTSPARGLTRVARATSVDEFAFIESLLIPAAGHRADVVLGIGDDGAILEPPIGEQLVVVADTLVDGVHFPHDFPAADIAYRALAVNLSDLAAMGAVPYWATLALTIPEANETWLRAFADSLRHTLAQHGVALIGGDTTRGPLTVTIQLIGGVPRGAALTRHGAHPGDSIYVSGYLGDAAAGLGFLQRATARTQDVEALISKFRRPRPQVALGQALRGVASACIDISDGLLADLNHVATRSGCGAEISDVQTVLSPALRRVTDADEAFRCALSGGDDYELCLCVPSVLAEKFADLSLAHPSIKKIGRMVATPGILVTDPAVNMKKIRITGYRHFI